MANQDDGLFLLEVLIDKIIYSKSPCFSDKAFRTCVSVKCPACDPLELCDDDAGGSTGLNDSPFMKSFNSGKSCLFSLKQSDISSAMSKFEIKVSVFKELPCGCLPTKINLGEATIDMTKEFVQARKSFLEDPDNVSYQALKDSFHIKGSDGVETGEILMFLRISCFGKLIVTKFRGSGGPPVLGSGMGGSGIVDRSCNPPRKSQSPGDPCACGAARAAGGGAAAGSSRGGAGGVCDPARDPYNSMPCEDPDDPCYCTGAKPDAKQQMACRNTQQYCLHVPKGRNTLFEEIGTNLCGNELKIKVPAHASTIKKISQTHCAMQRPFVPQKGNDKKNTAPCKPPCAKNQISLALPSEDVCCKGPQLAETQFTCTTEGCPMVSKHNQPPPSLQRSGTGDVTQNKDVFVLKVAKTAVQGDRKCKLELELVTPKGGDQIPPVQKKDIRMQSDLDCECCVRRIRKTKRVRRAASPKS
ncbi:uncharacterized protein LOC133516088 isoform X2 [Cydia pomonella]|uniref:uncharacterized protein LOC133516088 isoform X2 n=1 Tax=Cydia pomonella TaxID=82600 RepID=UPI002ADE3A0C|nr:uncharacterized protein LOC133516088 isoform X2 [Cydia pomonella]